MEYRERYTKPFRVFDSTGYSQKPSYIGYDRCVILYENMLYRNGEQRSGPPDDTSINYWVELLNTLNYKGPLMLDIEHWPIYSDPVTLQYMIDVAEKFKRGSNGYTVGYYAMVPQRNTVESLTPWVPGFKAWQQRNDRVQPLADSLDVLFPSLYTLYPDVRRWEQYATENILEAKRLAPTKPIYPVLWPQYHTSVIGAEPHAYIDMEFWYQQLMFVYRYCDGAVIWSIVASETWSTNLPWYQLTRAFMRKYGAT